MHIIIILSCIINPVKQYYALAKSETKPMPGSDFLAKYLSPGPYRAVLALDIIKTVASIIQVYCIYTRSKDFSKHSNYNRVKKKQDLHQAFNYIHTRIGKS